MHIWKKLGRNARKADTAAAGSIRMLCVWVLKMKSSAPPCYDFRLTRPGFVI